MHIRSIKPEDRSMFQEQLIEAIRNGNIKYLLELLKHNIDINHKDKTGRTPLIWAIVCGTQSCVVSALLDGGAQINLRSEEENIAPLFLALYKNRGDIAELLLDRKADINCEHKVEGTPLLWAARWGLYKAAKKLLDRGALVDPETKEGVTPLTVASRFGYTEVMKLLIKGGANLNHFRPQHSPTALTLAAHMGHKDAVHLLLESHAEINAQNELGDTPLLEATILGHKDIVSILLAYGANSKHYNNQGYNAYNLAKIHCHPTIRQILEQDKKEQEKERKITFPLRKIRVQWAFDFFASKKKVNEETSPTVNFPDYLINLIMEYIQPSNYVPEPSHDYSASRIQNIRRTTRTP